MESNEINAIADRISDKLIAIVKNQLGEPAAPTGPRWAKGTQGFPIKKPVIAKKFINHLNREVVGTASSTTGEMICFDWGVSSVCLAISHQELNDLEWLDESAAPKPYDELYRLVFSNLAKLRARCRNNERMIDMADNIRGIIEDVTIKMLAMPQTDPIECPWQLYQSRDESAAGREDAVEVQHGAIWVDCIDRMPDKEGFYTVRRAYSKEDEVELSEYSCCGFANYQGYKVIKWLDTSKVASPVASRDDAKPFVGLRFRSRVAPLNLYEVVDVFEQSNEFKVKVTQECEVDRAISYEVWSIDGFEKYYKLGVYFKQKEK